MRLSEAREYPGLQILALFYWEAHVRGLLSKAHYISLPFGVLRSHNWDIFSSLSKLFQYLLSCQYFFVF